MPSGKVTAKLRRRGWSTSRCLAGFTVFLAILCLYSFAKARRRRVDATAGSAVGAQGAARRSIRSSNHGCGPAAKNSKRNSSRARGLELKRFYTPEDLAGWDYENQAGYPGEYPYTRGVYPSLYRSRLWTMRQYAGFGSARESNARYRYLLSQGQTGLSVAFDLPTQIGLGFRPSPGARRSGPRGRGHRLARRHGNALRTASLSSASPPP